MSARIVRRGELATPRSSILRAAAMVGPGTAWIAAFLAIPLLGLVALAMARRGPVGEIEWVFSFANFRRLAGFDETGAWSSTNLRVLGATLGAAGATTVVSIALAYPMAFFVAGRGPRARALLLALVAAPMGVNVVIRAYAWKLTLSAGLPPAEAAAALGFVGAGENLYPGWFAIVSGMVSASLPFAVLPLYAGVERIDRSLVEAARDLYASESRVFFHAILPQTAPALAAASILTFVPAAGMFVIPEHLGGSKYRLAGNLIQLQFGPARDIPFGAAISLGLVALTLAGLFLYRKAGAR